MPRRNAFPDYGIKNLLEVIEPVLVVSDLVPETRVVARVRDAAPFPLSVELGVLGLISGERLFGGFDAAKRIVLVREEGLLYEPSGQ